MRIVHVPLLCVSIALLFHTHWTFLHTHPHTLHHFVGPARKSLLTCGVAADMWLEKESVCNVAVEVPIEGGDDDEEKTIGNFLFLLVFFLFLLFQRSFLRYIVFPTISHAGFLWAQGEKKYVHVYRNRVYLIFHDTNNPIIMTPPLFSYSYQVLFFLFFFSSSLSNLSLSKKSACSTLDCLTSTKNSKKRKLARLRANKK